MNARTSTGAGIPNSATRGYGRLMEFRVLGAIEVVENGDGPIPLGGPKQRAVLAHLLLRANHLVPTDVLIDEVWGEEPPETVRNALQSYASHLRKALGTERLEGSRAGYVLRAEPSELDAVRFQSLLRDARRLLPIDAKAAVGAFDHALDLWRGPAFGDLAAEASLRSEAARLDDLRLSALEERIDAQLTLGDLTEVIGELENLTTRHPLRERFWEQRMLALYRAGRQGEALAAYQRAREVLADDLGIDPSPELRRVHERILAQSPDLDPGGEPLRGYRLLERVGEDPFGVVYRATQPNVGREVAIRVVHKHRANDPAFVRRFEPDAQAVAALEHPHIAPVYDYWREPGRAYVVTRFLRGGSLRQLLDRSDAMPHERAIRVLEQVAYALRMAHRRGVVHGDLRASNVLFDEEGNAYITDFSIGIDSAGARDDLEAFAALARETLGERLSMEVGEALRRAETAQGSDDDAEVLADLASVLGTRIEGHAPLVAETRNPYKGLRPFFEADALDFFGREAFIQRLVERLTNADPSSRFIAVVGPSGSGKSSVVRAGLVAAIRRGAVPSSDAWLVTEMHPGHHPLEELDAALMRVAVHPPAGLLGRLESGPRGLVDVADAIVPGGTELLLIVDQFEEAFTLTETEDDRALFLESLRVATADPASRVRVIVTLRADFYDRPLRYPRVGQLLGSSTEVLSPLTPEELERAIVRPAEHAGLTVDSALVPRIAADVAAQPGALPLVQYALTELYDRRHDGRLTLEAYREIGGVGGALAASAEHLYATRQRDGREAVRQLFLRLVMPGEGAADTRRRVPLSELSAIEVDTSAMESSIGAYGRHRLLTFDRDPSTREPTVEVAHEALLGAWERLRGWIDEGREDLRMHRRLSDAANEWERSGPEPSFLLTGSRLGQFESWASTTTLALGPGERAYLLASITGRETERSAEAARGERERTLERHSVKRLRALVAVLAVAALVAGTLTVFALNQSARAERASRLATTRELAAAANANLDVDHQLATLLALEALRTARGVDQSIDPQVEDVLRRAAPALAIDTTSIVGTDIRAISLASDGTAVAIVGRDGSVGAWDLFNGSRIIAIRPTEAPCGKAGCPEAFTVALSEDASRLAIGDGDGLAHVWDLGSAREILTVPSMHPLPSNGKGCLLERCTELGESAAPSVAIDPGGQLLATGTSDLPTSGSNATVRIWDIATGRKTDVDICHAGLVTRFFCWGARFLTFSPDGTRLFIENGSGGFPARVADVMTGKTSTLTADHFWDAIRNEGWRFAYASTTGRVEAAFGPDDGFAWFTGSEVRLAAGDGYLHLQGHTLPIIAAEFSRDGTQLVTGSLDGTARVWSRSTGDLVYTTPVEPSDVAAVAFSPDGDRIVAVYSDGRIIVHPIALLDAIAIAEARLTRGFTDEECRRYLHLPSCPAD
jgi:DNA-binding SARP family transcriptional activator/WD40 repeat protein